MTMYICQEICPCHQNGQLIWTDDNQNDIILSGCDAVSNQYWKFLSDGDKQLLLYMKNTIKSLSDQSSYTDFLSYFDNILISCHIDNMCLLSLPCQHHCIMTWSLTPSTSGCLSGYILVTNRYWSVLSDDHKRHFLYMKDMVDITDPEVSLFLTDPIIDHNL